MALRVQGLAGPDRLADALCVTVDEARARVSALSEAGIVEERTGRLAGYTLTLAGNATLDEALTEEGLRGDEELTDAYQRFLVLNKRLLETCSAWQVRSHGSIEEPNDHSDPDYDNDVIERLGSLHDRTTALLRKVSERAPRFDAYCARLGSCVDRLREGDRRAFTAPMAESYHTVWFELHQDLLLTLGLEREE